VKIAMLAEISPKALYAPIATMTNHSQLICREKNQGNKKILNKILSASGIKVLRCCFVYPINDL
jgi:hypothetical protein